MLIKSLLQGIQMLAMCWTKDRSYTYDKGNCSLCGPACTSCNVAGPGKCDTCEGLSDESKHLHIIGSFNLYHSLWQNEAFSWLWRRISSMPTEICIVEDFCVSVSKVTRHILPREISRVRDAYRTAGHASLPPTKGLMDCQVSTWLFVYFGHSFTMSAVEETASICKRNAHVCMCV